MDGRTYLAIDLKSFYASVECVERGLDPMKTNLVVADASRTEKTICLAVSPSLKAYGIPGRARLFEIVQKVREVNTERRKQAPGHVLTGSSVFDDEIRSSPFLSVDYIVAPPRMAHYMRQSAGIYNLYLQYVAPDDIHVYSIDEVFMDVTAYLERYAVTAREFAQRIILDVLRTTGITATAGIGPNLYLCKIAMDIWAKHVEPDENGVRIAELDEISYRRQLWTHRPLTDFWRVGHGYAKKLEDHGLYTMGDVARCSLRDEELLYRLFGVNAELLIDHAWGWEPCTIADIHRYRPQSNSLGSGQVLDRPYSYEQARLVVREMADALALELVDKQLATDQIVLTVGYDIENLSDPQKRLTYRGSVSVDHYGRSVPKHAHGTANLGGHTSSSKAILDAVTQLFDRITDHSLLVRRLNLTAAHVLKETLVRREDEAQQLDFFTDYEEQKRLQAEKDAALAREKKRQQAILSIQHKYGKNALLKGMNLTEGATGKARNEKIGGHKA